MFKARSGECLKGNRHFNCLNEFFRRDRVRLVAIVGHVVSALSSTEQALTSLSALMAPFVQQLNEITNFPGVWFLCLFLFQH